MQAVLDGEVFEVAEPGVDAAQRIIHIVIPGRRAAANRESSNPRPVITGFRVLGPLGLAPE